ncbi:MAG: TIGR00730 family Rossman fold protein [Roseiarcus sp.]|jgi:uncharacterized protein (TIGR00730 family)
MKSIRNICVYCGSSSGADPRFSEAAETLGAAMADAGIGLVFGGGEDGLMGQIARAVLAGGGRVTGVIPGFLVEREHALMATQELIVVEDMHRRKQLMFERADAFIALPGGIGTLEELVEQLTWVQLGRHAKPVLLADIAGFWRPLLSLIAHMNALGFIRHGAEIRYMVAERIEDALPMIERAALRILPPTSLIGGPPAGFP